MAEKTAAQKGHIKPGTTIAVLNPVPSVVDALGLPEGVEFVDADAAALVLLFVNDRAELDRLMRPAIAALAPGAIIWVLYRKGSKAAGLDMSRDDVWAVAESMSMSPLGLVSVDDTWSAFRLKPPA